MQVVVKKEENEGMTENWINTRHMEHRTVPQTLEATRLSTFTTGNEPVLIVVGPFWTVL